MTTATRIDRLKSRVSRGALVALAALASGCGAESPQPWPQGAATIADPSLSELSGMVASFRQPGLLWGINDSGSFDRLFRIGRDGEALGRVWVRGVWLRDAETLAIWRHAGQDWLLIGDVGDNREWRDEVAVHVLPEPSPEATSVRVAWSVRFRYPDGPHDAEGIAVDHRNGDLLVMTKREQTPRLFRVPLQRGDDDTVHIAEQVATLPDDATSAEVTGLDLGLDGRRLVVLTYRDLHLWQREEGESWAQTLSRPPQTHRFPAMRKAEAMAISDDATSVVVGSERTPTPLWRMGLGALDTPGSMSSVSARE
jgi:hypothetical protein